MAISVKLNAEVIVSGTQLRLPVEVIDDTDGFQIIDEITASLEWFRNPGEEIMLSVTGDIATSGDSISVPSGEIPSRADYSGKKIRVGKETRKVVSNTANVIKPDKAFTITGSQLVEVLRQMTAHDKFMANLISNATNLLENRRRQAAIDKAVMKKKVELDSYVGRIIL